MYICRSIIVMRKLDFCTTVICIFTFFVVVSTLQTKANRMVLSDVSLNDVETLSSDEAGLDCSNCNVAGGKGAISCSCTGGTISVDTPIGGIGGGGASCDVTVSDGYYACCYKDANGFCRCPSCEKLTNQ